MQNLIHDEQTVKQEISRLFGDGEFSWAGFSLRRTMQAIERVFIVRAIRDAGNVSGAAQLLGLNSHQSLISTLNARHPELRESLGLKIRRRHKPLIKKNSKHESVKRRQAAAAATNQSAPARGEWEKEAL